MSTVKCGECSHYRPGTGSDMALGRCLSQPWDGHPGQWPCKSHPCSAFMALAEFGTAEDPAREWPFYLKELRSTECQCGQPKTEGQSLCRGCYRTLPEELRKSLYKRIGQGYEQAYEQAVVYLDRVSHQ